MFFRKDIKKWRACIWTDTGRKTIGNFNSEDEAHRAYIEAKKIYHPEWIEG